MTNQKPALRNLAELVEEAVQRQDVEAAVEASKALHNAIGATTILSLIRGLEAIVSARRDLSHCSTPGTCLYPQHHKGDESYAAFAMRLQEIAEKALIESGAA